MSAEDDYNSDSDAGVPIDIEVGRKRSIEDDGAAQSKNPKPKRKRTKKSKKNDEDSDIDFVRSINLRLGRLDAQLIADHIAKQTKRFDSDLSLVELEDRRISGIQCL